MCISFSQVSWRFYCQEFLFPLLTSSLFRHKTGNRYEMISGSFVFTKNHYIWRDWPRNRQFYENEIRYGFTYSVRNIKSSLESNQHNWIPISFSIRVVLCIFLVYKKDYLNLHSTWFNLQLVYCVVSVYGSKIYLAITGNIKI